MSEESKTKSVMSCEQCGANLSVDPDQDTVTCEYCGSTYSVSVLLGESEEVRLSKLRFKQEQERRAQRDAEFAKRAELRAAEDERRRQEKFDKGIFSKSLIVGFAFVLFMLLGAVAEEFYVTSALLIGQAVFIALAWLTGRQIIHTKNKFVYRIFTIIVVAMIVPVMIGLVEEESYSYGHKDTNVTYEWPESGLYTMIPKPESNNGIISTNTSYIDAEIYNVTPDQKNAYISACIANGFTVDQDTNNTRFTAFNSEGYKLEIYYFDENELDISLSAPKGVGTLTWPTSGPAAKLPKPASTQGKIISDYATNFRAEVGNTNLDAFGVCTAQCLEAGFNNDYSRRSDYFSGKNSDGWTLTVDYYGANVMLISLYKHD